MIETVECTYFGADGALNTRVAIRAKSFSPPVLPPVVARISPAVGGTPTAGMPVAPSIVPFRGNAVPFPVPLPVYPGAVMAFPRALTIAPSIPSFVGGPLAPLPIPSFAPPVVEPLTEEEIMDFLYPDQADHVNAVVDRFGDIRILVDTSPMGAGKTYTACAIAARLRLNIVLFCGKQLAQQWIETAEIFGVTIHLLSTYESVAKQRYLREIVEARGTTQTTTRYEVNPEWETLLQEGIMLICDECHEVKNQTANKTKATTALLAALANSTSRSRAFLLSGTPFDQEKFVESYYRLVGFLPEGMLLCRNEFGTMMYDGFEMIMHRIRLLDPNADLSRGVTLIRKQQKKKAVLSLVYQWFVDVIFPRLSFSMPVPNIQASFKKIQGYYSANLGYMGQAADIIARMIELTGFTEDMLELNIDQLSTRTNLFHMLQDLEVLKMEGIVIPQSIKILEANPKAKVVIFIHALSSIDLVKQELEEYGVEFLNGSITSPKVRHDKCTRFNTDPKCRVMVSTIRTGGVGINLGDAVGDSPRTVFIIPRFDIKEIQQALYRIYRANTKSDCTGIIVYFNLDIQEQKLIAALMRKTKVFQDICRRQVATGMIFPGDLPIERFGETHCIMERRAEGNNSESGSESE